uniref:Uncharacterized protein n=1 Tax=Glossina palpalis gambiensis TaxID=67801 RepID=A0A1B0AVX7_9MUSC
MKNHKKYAKLPQDLDLSFQQQLDVDTAATDDFNLTGSGLDDDDDNILGDQDAVADDEDEVIEDDDEEDEVVYATAAAAATGLSGTGSCGLRLVGATAAARKQQLNKKVLSGLGRDSVIEVRNFYYFTGTGSTNGQLIISRALLAFHNEMSCEVVKQVCI